MFLNSFPHQKPINDIKKDAIPIINPDSNKDVEVNLIDAPGKAKENRFASRVKSKLSVNADLPGPIQPIKLCDPKLWEDSVSTVYSGISQLLQEHRLLSYTAAACLRNEGY